MGQHYLRYLFDPETIAVFGANDDPDTVGGRVFSNLKQGGFAGAVFALNPHHAEVGNERCYASLEDLGQRVDLAVIASPADTVANIMRNCGEHGVRAVIVITAGFSERGGRGAELEKELLAIARRYGMRMLGPNCLGLLLPSKRLNASFSKNAAIPGHLALVSQSGALCTAILDWAAAHDIGFSAIVSLGDTADIDFGDVLDFLAQDSRTRSILLYVEGIRHARGFVSGLRAAARLKPVIVLKSGRHEAGRRAAVTHTGAIVGADAVFDAVLQRAGAVRAMNIGQLFAAAQLLSTRCRIKGRRLAIITNGGGLGVMATDRASDLAIVLAELSPGTLAALDAALPPHWSHANPVDLLGDAGPERYRRAVQACLADPGVDGILVMLSPQAMTDGMACAEAVIESAKATDKPLMACWMGELLLRPAKALLASHGIPEFDSPEASVEAFAFLAEYHDNQQLLLQVPGPLAADSRADVAGARLIVQSALAEGRTMLDGIESRALLHAFLIPVTPCISCHSAHEALVAAEGLGFPVAMKISSRDITHKSDVGGVRLDIPDARAVRTVYEELLREVRRRAPAARIDCVTVEPMYRAREGRELLLGITRDPVFGPAMVFGAGGVIVELLPGRTIALPPLNTFMIERMIEKSAVAPLLDAYRGRRPADLASLSQALRRVSELACEIPELVSLDINPLVADVGGVLALDARIAISQPVLSSDPYAHMAIQPYPAQLVSVQQLADGTNITIRPIRPEDAAIEKSFVDSLSSETRYFRFMQELRELTREMLVRFTQLDYDREMAMIAVLEAGEGASETELGVARYTMNPDGTSCEFALVVADAWQHRGIGTRLMKALMDAARARGFTEMNGEVIASNRKMIELVRNLGFSTERSRDDSEVLRVSHWLQP